VLVVVLPDPFHGWGCGGTPLTVGTLPKVWSRGKNESSAKDDAPERFRCGTI